jgi:hypothetical protein
LGINTTEPGGGSDLANIKTWAKSEKTKFIVNGEKAYISGVRESNEWGRGHLTLFKSDPSKGYKGSTFAYFPAKAPGTTFTVYKSLCTDYQWLSEDRLVGLSGKKTSPRLVISLGISGQIQYTVGIRGARIAVAINKDKQAPIFAMSDYGIVGNLYDGVPLLAEKLKST